MHTEARPSEVNDRIINKENPWPGLSAFTEENALYFHGRDKEADELFRLIKRETLTVQFGLSGLGKTSLLQAGVFPLLRREDYLPVYVRLSYAEGAPDLVTQTKETLREAADKAGISSPLIRAGETLWAYFHRTTNDFKTAEGRIVSPVLIFDQFEEMFTLGAGNDQCQQRITAFLTELGDLIENRPPDDVAKQLETDAEETFSFYKNEYKVVLTLREDFLANLEGLANQLPSITNNRFRIKKMNGAQALEVVMKAGGHLVDQTVAERIVKMVAGRDVYSDVPLSTLEVEPTLLSVFCRELNNNRIARGDSRITPQLLSGSKEVILTGFYDRALKGFDDRLRYFIEDKLLTGSGYRNSVDLQDALKMPGVSREAIFTLIDRRLLRIEDSARMPRVELTHDVLTEVIKKSRDERQAREDAEAAEAQALRAAAALRGKDEELRHTKSRNRGLQVLCLLAIICVAIACWQWSVAVDAKHQAIALSKKVKESNDRADELIEFTLKDLHQKLSGIGRVPLLNETAKRALPLLKVQIEDEGGIDNMSDTQLKFQESVYNTLGDVSRSQASVDEALDHYQQSIAIAQKRVDRNPGKIEFLEDLAEKLSGLSNPLDGGSKADALVFEAKFSDASDLYRQSLDVTDQVSKLASTPEDKIWVERERANIYGRQGDILRSTGKADIALATLYEQSLDLRQKVVAQDSETEAYQLDLANAYSRIGYAHNSLGHYEEARKAYLVPLEIRTKYAHLHQGDVNWQRSLFYSYLTLGRLLVMEGKLGGDDGAQFYLTNGLENEKSLAAQNPANSDLQRELAIGSIFLGNCYRAEGNWKSASDNFSKSLGPMETLAKQDPNNLLWKNFLGVGYLDLGDAMLATGAVQSAADNYQAALKIFLTVVGKNKANSDWQHNLALAYQRIGAALSVQGKATDAQASYQKAVDTYNTTIQLNQKDPVTYNGRAWLLATCPVPAAVNGPQALQDATTAVTLTQQGAWEEIDTLAAADAAAGHFDAAKLDEQKALKIIDGSDTNEISAMKARLALYESEKPFRSSAPASADR